MPSIAARTSTGCVAQGRRLDAAVPRDDGRFAERRIGPERKDDLTRSRRSWTTASALRSAPIWAVAPLNPPLWSVCGHDPGDARRSGTSRRGWVPEQKISDRAGGRGLHRRVPAFAEFQDSDKGTLTRGKLADLVMLSEDVFFDSSGPAQGRPGARHYRLAARSCINGAGHESGACRRRCGPGLCADDSRGGRPFQSTVGGGADPRRLAVSQAGQWRQGRLVIDEEIARASPWPLAIANTSGAARLPRCAGPAA